MRLHRVELLYAFRLRFRCKGSEEHRRAAMAKPLVGVAGYGQTPCRGDRLRPRPPTRGSRLQRAAGPLAAKASCSTAPIGAANGACRRGSSREQGNWAARVNRGLNGDPISPYYH
ncbi:hypothetical protein GW17_00011408 [Ensete ventricosum]|nr:hypothetical protein GW17_00011408 [Ensete ventricosum]